VPVAIAKSKAAKWLVDEAKTPSCAQMGLLEVAAVMTPKLGVKVKFAWPVEAPQALPVLEIVPLALKVAQPGVPPAEETIRLVVDAVPVTANAVVVALVSKVLPKSVDEAKRFEVSELNTPPMVVEPVTASADEVAPPVTERFNAAARPVLLTLNKVEVADAVEDPMANSVVAVSPLLVWIANLANGELVPTPSEPLVGSENAVAVSFAAGSDAPKMKLPMLSWLLADADATSALYPIVMLLEPEVLFCPAKAPKKRFCAPVLLNPASYPSSVVEEITALELKFVLEPTNTSAL